MLGAIPPVLLMGWLDFQISESVLPPYMYPGGYRFPGSRFPNTIAGNRPPNDIAKYAFDLLVGERGLFAFCPLLLVSLAGLVNVLRQRRHRYWLAALVVLASSVALVVYLVTQTSNFGGLAYGERWLTAAVPFILFFSPFVPLPRGRSALSALARLAVVGAIVATALLSIGSAAQGAMRPWRFTAPPLYVAYPVADEQWEGLVFTWLR